MAPTDEDQAFFNSWDFVSMHTLKVELGISSEMAVHDQSFKVWCARLYFKVVCVLYTHARRWERSLLPLSLRDGSGRPVAKLPFREPRPGSFQEESLSLPFSMRDA